MNSSPIFLNDMVRADFRILPGAKNKEEFIRLVDKAIKIIETSGTPYEVTPTSTILMGELPEILNLVKAIHEELKNEGLFFLAWELRVFEFKP